MPPPLNPQQFMYHLSPEENRQSIQEQGLLADKTRVQGKHRVYLTDSPERYGYRRSGHLDKWKVDITGIPTRTDVNDKKYLGIPGSRYAQRNIGPERLERITGLEKR